jgi:hypothetical protein
VRITKKHAPVRREGRRGVDSVCIMPGCGQRAGLDKWFCMEHWAEVPYPMQLSAMVCPASEDKRHALRIRTYLLCRRSRFFRFLNGLAP